MTLLNDWGGFIDKKGKKKKKEVHSGQMTVIISDGYVYILKWCRGAGMQHL